MLRTSLFKTLARVNTRVIAVRDTLTVPSEDTDAFTIDARHCREGRLGIGYHFLIIHNGDIQLCRDVNTCGSHTRNFDDISVAIGITGGITGEGTRAFTRNEEQIEALADLTAFLSTLYPEAGVNDQPLKD